MVIKSQHNLIGKSLNKFNGIARGTSIILFSSCANGNLWKKHFYDQSFIIIGMTQYIWVKNKATSYRIRLIVKIFYRTNITCIVKRFLKTTFQVISSNIPWFRPISTASFSLPHHHAQTATVTITAFCTMVYFSRIYNTNHSHLHIVPTTKWTVNLLQNTHPARMSL